MSGQDPRELDLLAQAIATFQAGYADLPERPRPAALAEYFDRDRMQEALTEAATRLREDLPYQHPLYVGQMLKPPHPVARLAYSLAMRLNPNNHALDGGRASSAMEKEVVAGLARMCGFREHLGHLTGGGTMANFEALWVARELRPGRGIAASAQAHYTQARLSAVLGVPFVPIPIDASGRIDLGALEELLARGEVATVVATMGTTGASRVDPLDAIIPLARRHGVRVHADAAYGGYFTLASNLAPETRRAFDALAEVDSIVIDPHKHGLQPYGCGSVLFRDPSVGRFYRHDSPYTYFSSDELHLGEISLECSRPGAAAVALWATMRMLPLEGGGAFARSLERCRDGGLALHQALSTDPAHRERFAPLFLPELDIVVWAARAPRASESSAQARRVFAEAAGRGLHLAVASFPRSMVAPCGAIPDDGWDQETVVCLRACVMKPEHLDWMDEILRRL